MFHMLRLHRELLHILGNIGDVLLVRQRACDLFDLDSVLVFLFFLLSGSKVVNSDIVTKLCVNVLQ